MNKKIIYETQWVATDSTKEYPHGWGFEPILVMFPQDADPSWCAEICRQHLSNNEFECIGAMPKGFVDAFSQVMGLPALSNKFVEEGRNPYSYPMNEKEYLKWKDDQDKAKTKFLNELETAKNK